MEIIPVDNNIFKTHNKYGKTYIPPKGNIHAKLMLILSHPSYDDVLNGQLLAGDYGREIRAAVELAGIDFNDLYITSMVKFGIGDNLKPSTALIKAFSGILEYELNLVRPKLIMSLGAEVLRQLTKAKFKQSDILGEIIDSPYGKLIPNYSPGMITKQDPKKRPIFRDIFIYAARYIYDQLNYDKFEWEVITDCQQAREIVNDALARKCFNVGYDAEWYGKKFPDDEILYTVQLSFEQHKAVIFDISPDGKTENLELLQTLKPLLEHPEVKRLGWNIRADDKRLVHRGFVLDESTLGFDGMKAMAFFDSRYPKGLETGIKKFTNYELYYVPVLSCLKQHNLDISDVALLKFKEPSLFYKYCAGDAVTHREACLNMMKLMEKLPESQRNYYYNIYLPLSAYFLDLEYNGIPIDIPLMEKLTQQYNAKYEELNKELQTLLQPLGFLSEAEFKERVQALVTAKIAATPAEAVALLNKHGIYNELNPNSAIQKKFLLFDVLKLEPAYYTRAGKLPKPKTWYDKQKPSVQLQYSPSTNSKSLSTIKFKLLKASEETNSPEIQQKLNIVTTLLNLSRIGVFAHRFLNKKGTEFENETDDENESEESEGLKASYWNALCKDGKIHPDFYECLANFRSSSRPNVQNAAAKVLSHIPEIFVPGYNKMTKEQQKKYEDIIPENIRHIYYPGKPDWKWVEVDVAGADLMIAAYISQDELYINDLLQGNFHLKKAREYFRDETITKEDYSKYVSSKSLTFRVAYTAELQYAALPIQAEIFAESGHLIDLSTIEYALNTWKQYTNYMKFREKCKNQVTENRYIENIRGFRYYFDESDNFGIIAAWQNEALAFPIASELALFLWDVSVNFKRELVKQKLWLKYCYPVNSVHDACYWIIHQDLLKDNYFPEVCKYYFTEKCRIATGDKLGIEMSVADRWKGKHEVFHGETKWDFKTKQWIWK